MKNIWKLFVGDVRRLTSNIVSIIIVTGLVVIPGLFSWFNISASWDPFANTGNLKFAVANDDEGYKSGLIPVKISIGDQVVNTLRANDQMDWTFTTKKEAIDGTKSGKYYAAVVIPKDFSTRMMTFFTADGDHATLTYYNNEKKNALAPKITGQGADTVAAQINEMFSKALTSTALNIASQLADELDKPESRATLTNFSNNMGNFANTLTDTSSALTTFSSLTLSAQNLLDSSNSLLSNVSGSAKNAVNELKQSKNGIDDLTGAVTTSTNALSTALSSSSNSFGAVSTDIDSVFNNAGTQAGNTATALRNQAANVSKQAQSYQNIYDALDGLSNNDLVPEVAKIAINHLKTNVGATITQLNDLANSLNTSADNIDAKVSDTTADRERVNQLAQQAKASIDGIKTDFDSQLKPQLNDISDSISNTVTALSSTAADLKGALGDLNSTTKSADKQLTNIRTVLDSTAESLTKAGTALSSFNGTLSDALNSGNMDTVKEVLGNNTDSLAAALAAPVQVKRTAVFPVKNFGSQLAPFYTILPLFVGSLLMAVTLKPGVSRKNREGLDNPKPHQLFLGHYGVFGVIALLQSTFSLGGNLLFLHVQAVHPWLFMLAGWTSSLVFSFFTYTMVASFGNVGKAIGVLVLVAQISGSNGAYPLAVLPKIISDISPFLPATHSIVALRAAIAGIYNNDYWHALGSLLLFLIPLLLIGLALRIPLVKFNKWYVAKVESTKVIS
ncbi:YhgE/Pip family protein [Bifidobacterium catenulatum subsp. kashiwanohense]|uniref:YhgE/Pip family protein n=1 Tax=Bifidobacterium catenulatum TaxID=1686 RepID=UPI003D07DBBC